ncbi:MAG: siphovirus Gp157 family protein [Gammaproteobacteria bacterium]|nr:siphovirus Gp157 family protein [Gammaproteobacteria bacterium]
MADNKTMPDLHEALDKLTYDVLHEPDEERREELRQELVSTLEAVDDKAGAYLRVIDRHEMEIESAKAYAEAHKRRAERMKTSQEFLQNMLRETMRLRHDSHGLTEMRTPSGRWIRYYPENKKTVLLIDDERLPEEWTKTTVVPRKADIRKALKGGDSIPGVTLAEEGYPVIRWEKV